MGCAASQDKQENNENKPQEQPKQEEPAPAAAPVAAPLQDAHDIMFNNAHTAHLFQDKPVDDALLEKALELAQLAPTAFNCLPMRVVFVKSAEGKEKLLGCLMDGNKPRVTSAPVTAIVAFDKKFYTKLDTLCPAVPGLVERYANDEAGAEATMIRNANLQGGYLLLALRSQGLDVGAMSGFDNAAVDAAFLAGDESTQSWSSNFIVSIGYADTEKNFPRAPRLAFKDAAQYQ